MWVFDIYTSPVGRRKVKIKSDFESLCWPIRRTKKKKKKNHAHVKQKKTTSYENVNLFFTYVAVWFGYMFNTEARKIYIVMLKFPPNISQHLHWYSSGIAIAAHQRIAVVLR